MYGIIGFPLQTTFSPDYFNAKFKDLGIDAMYKKFPLEHMAQLPSLIKEYPDLKGLNVTIPHKQHVIPYLDSLDTTAATIGAVNCIQIKEGKLKGFNTDVTGFKASLQPLLQPQHDKALILGTGGASKAVAYALQQLDIPFQFVSREKKEGPLTYSELDTAIVSSHKLIINTTPLGMHPKEHSAPDIPYHAVGAGHLLYDLVYSPAETLFLAKGKAQGAAIKNGYEMLILQAEAAWAIWNS